MVVLGQFSYRAVVRREGSKHWIGLATKQGFLTFALDGCESAGTASPPPLPGPIAAALRPVLDRSTASPYPPADDMGAMMEPVDAAALGPISSVFELCWPEFVEHQGHVFRLPPGGLLPSTTQAGDRTGAEAFVNHVHLNDLFRDDSGECTYQLTRQQCFQIAEMWMTKLKHRFPRRYFVMYLFIDGEETHLRFHVLRSSEPLWADLDLIFDDPDQSTAVWFF